MSKIYPNKFVPFNLLRITIFKSEFEISLRNVKLEHENHNKRSVPGSSGLSIFLSVPVLHNLQVVLFIKT